MSEQKFGSEAEKSSGQSVIPEKREAEKPIECEAQEWAPKWAKDEIYQIYLKSNDPRFKLVEAAYSIVHPGGHGMGVTTDSASSFGLPLAEARNKIAAMVEQVRQPDFLRRVNEKYLEYVKVKDEYDSLSKLSEYSSFDMDDESREKKDDAEKRMEEIREELRELIPGTTNY